MGRALTIFFGLLLFGVLVWVCLGHREGIQREIADNAKGALLVDGHDFARASADGQTVILTGTTATAAQKLAAEQSVAAVPGVIEVKNKIALLTDVPPPGPDSRPILTETEVQPPPVIQPAPEVVAEPVPLVESLQIRLDGENRSASVAGVTLAEVADGDRRALLGEAISAALPDWQIASQLSADASERTDLLPAVQRVLPTLTGAIRAQLDADADGIRVDAELASFADRSALEAVLDELQTQDGLAQTDLSWLLESPPPNADSCQQAFDQLLGADSIMFTTNRAEIRPGSIGLLDKLVEVATDCDVSVEIEGHTDSRGSAELNNALSQARADSVRSYLIDKGVGAERINAKGFGSARPIADNNTINGRQANRRIEFRVQRTDS